jgi:hypothetical protein
VVVDGWQRLADGTFERVSKEEVESVLDNELYEQEDGE